MADQTTYTYELTNDQQEILLGIMVNGNYRKREVPYSLWSIEGDHFNATLYSKEKHAKRKLCVQGAKARDFVEFVLEPQVLMGASLGYEDVLNPELKSAHAGSDESGKGDFFGPLVVCCCYIDEEVSQAIDNFTYFTKNDRRMKLEVKDCKQMSDAQVLEAGRQLRALLGPTGYAVVKLGPAAYNRLYAKMRNINRMLAWAHGTAIEELLEKKPNVKRVVVDQFAPTEATIRRALKTRGKAATVEQRHKAESDPAVAAASVIARELFLRDIMKMSEEVGSIVPIGSSDPRVRALAEEMVRKNGPVWLMNHAKAHFQTTDKVLAACGKSRADLPPEGQVVSASRKAEEGERRETGDASVGEGKRRETRDASAGEGERRETGDASAGEGERRETGDASEGEGKRRETRDASAGEGERRETRDASAGEGERRETRDASADEGKRRETGVARGQKT